MDELSMRAVAARLYQLHGLSSQPQLARFLGVTEKTVANWINGRNYPDGRLARLIAELAGIDPCAFAAWIQAQRATNADEREMWLLAARRLLKPEKSSAAVATERIAPEAEPAEVARL